MTIRFLAGLVLCCICVCPAYPQQVPPDSANQPITLDVVVADKSGKPLAGLQQQDFTILDNKQPQSIVSFHAIERAATADPPAEVVLVVDEVNTSFEHVSVARQEVEKFLHQNGGELALPVSLTFLTDTGLTIGKSSSRDGKVLTDELNQNKNGLRTINRSQGFYGAGDRFQLSIRAVEQIAEYEMTRPGRKLVVWISPGWPLLSGPRVQLTTKDQQGIFNSIVGLTNGLRRAGVTLYAVDPLGMSDAAGLRTTYYEQFVKGVKAAKNAQAGNLGLQVLAAQSGGRVLNSSNDVAGEIATCLNDANAFYVLSFEALPGDGPNEYHALTVKVDKPGVTARTRAGYYAQPEQVSGR